jgi:CRP/FNR family transcriptional regulator, anaerobic regulatory protein
MHTLVANTSENGSLKQLGRTAESICEAKLIGITSKAFAAKHPIFFEGDAKSCVYRIEKGAIALYRMAIDGKRQVFDFGLPGDIVGLGAADAYSCTAQAIGAVRVQCIPLSSLNRLAAEDSGFALKLYQAVSSELEATRNLLMALARHNSLERVVIFLLTLSRRNALHGKNPSLLTLPMTRLDIGDLLGISIETVSRSLSKLRKFGMIDVIRTTTVQIIDLNGLNLLIGRATYH